MTGKVGWRYIDGVRRGYEYTVVLVSRKIMKCGKIAKARERMPFKNWRQALIKTLECAMMAATIQSSLNWLPWGKPWKLFSWKPVLLGLFRWEKKGVREYVWEVLISSTCLVKKALHSKWLNHKRVSKNGGQFLLFLADFLPLSIRCGPCRDLIFWPFVKTYAMDRAERCWNI